MKTKTVYICSNCGTQHLRWAGQCSSCQEWNTLEKEEINPSKSNNRNPIKISKTKPQKLSEIDISESPRLVTNIEEFDRVLGGGIIPGSLILVGGDPGIGKSTLMLQISSQLKNVKTLYITGEESLDQIVHRADRIAGINKEMLCLAETNLANILPHVENKEFDVVIIDSIQSIQSDDIESTAGSVIQLRECSQALMTAAKTTGTAVFLTGHVTKSGVIAGPKVLEHLVDTVLFFEGEKNYSYRILRAVKNRFGSTNEIGIFEMTDKGLMEVANPSEIFLNKHNTEESGIAISAAMEGTMPLLIEVQALVTSTSYGNPQRTVNGFDLRRLQMLLAVLEKRLGLKFSDCDVFINITGGFSINDTGIDLAIAAALISSYRDLPLSKDIALIGEIGLTGEIRNVTKSMKRISELEKLGYKSIICPHLGKDIDKKQFKIQIWEEEKIALAITKIF
ncbi:MAG: DNA repair protein RadA [Bacteroidetes bacterium 4572_77]|nr:MAG: DNA repair protein RadA [Bacteroidetes bacterium 4572_77]